MAAWFSVRLTRFVALLAVGILIALVAGHPPVGFIVAFAIVVVRAAVQLLGVSRLKLPPMRLAGRMPSLARHYAYVASEAPSWLPNVGGFLLLTN